MFNHDGGMWFGGGFMWLFWIFIIFAIVMLVRGMAGHANNSSESNRDETPLSILKKRYARGEISDEDFKNKSKELEK